MNFFNAVEWQLINWFPANQRIQGNTKILSIGFWDRTARHRITRMDTVTNILYVGEMIANSDENDLLDIFTTELTTRDMKLFLGSNGKRQDETYITLFRHQCEKTRRPRPSHAMLSTDHGPMDGNTSETSNTSKK